MKEKKLVFSFDIDTHKCIRDGVPRLVQLSKETDVAFTFFLNTGRAISVRDSLSNLFKTSTERKVANHMSALQKLGIRDYVIAAVFNPSLSMYQKQILELLNSDCEVGLHGGNNHALWASHAKQYSPLKIKKEIQKSIMKIKRIDNTFAPIGFASPDWNSPECLPVVLKELGFKYFRDNHGLDFSEIVNNGGISQLFVNLLGEPGGVAFFEHERACNKSTDEIINDVIEVIQKHDITVLYDHPYFAGVREIETLRKIIKYSLDNNIKIITLGELI